MLAETRYAKRGDVHIAYQVVGGGGLDLVLVSSWFSHLEARWELPSFAHYLRRLASFSRLISFDKYGTGLSDPVSPHSLPALEEWMDDVRTVLDAVGSEHSAVMGAGDGAMMAATFAATYPERVTALVLVNAAARMSWAPDYPIGLAPERQGQIVELVERAWGSGALMSLLAPNLEGDEQALQAWGRFFRLSASPATAAAVIRMLFELDIREVLPAIQAPTLVVHGRQIETITVENGRYLAEHIPDARLVELPSADYAFVDGDSDVLDVLIDEVEEFLTGKRHGGDRDRFLATVLVTDIVDSTGRAAVLGDERWKELLEAHDELVRKQLALHRGTLVRATGDGLLATFDGPARAIRCALIVREGLRRLGLETRAGLHTGEIERRGKGIDGIAVHIAARVQAAGEPGEVLVSRTVRDLTVGSGIEFADRGVHRLKGVPEDWQLFAVVE